MVDEAKNPDGEFNLGEYLYIGAYGIAEEPAEPLAMELMPAELPNRQPMD
jgi:hypothetical protein